MVSKKYKASVICKVECVFACKSGKRVIPVLAEQGYAFQGDGWLGALLGGLLFYDCSREKDMAAEMSDLVEVEIEGECVVAPTTTALVPVSTTTTSAPASRKRKLPGSEPEVRKWCQEKGHRRRAFRHPAHE